MANNESMLTYNLKFQSTFLFLLVLCFSYAKCIAQKGVGIGTANVANDAVLHIASSSGTPKGLLVPSMSTFERIGGWATSNGLIVFDTDFNAFFYFDNGSWIRLIASQAKGDLDLNGFKIRNLADGTNTGDAVNLDQFNTRTNAKLDKSGGTMSGNINMNSNKLTNVLNGSASGDAMNKNQIETLVQNLKNELGFLRVGSHYVGDIAGGDWVESVTFPSIGTSNYIILGSFESEAPNSNIDNDFSWVYDNKTTTSFDIVLREYESSSQQLRFRYVLINATTRTF